MICSSRNGAALIWCDAFFISSRRVDHLKLLVPLCYEKRARLSVPRISTAAPLVPRHYVTDAATLFRGSAFSASASLLSSRAA